MNCVKNRDPKSQEWMLSVLFILFWCLLKRCIYFYHLPTNALWITSVSTVLQMMSCWLETADMLNVLCVNVFKKDCVRMWVLPKRSQKSYGFSVLALISKYEWIFCYWYLLLFDHISHTFWLFGCFLFEALSLWE